MMVYYDVFLIFLQCVFFLIFVFVFFCGGGTSKIGWFL